MLAYSSSTFDKVELELAMKIDAQEEKEKKCFSEKKDHFFFPHFLKKHV